MKILDRYVLISFLKNYAISFMVLVGMYVVLDMVFNFDELVEVKSGADAGGAETVMRMLASIGDFYFYQAFLFFVHLSGIIPVVAAAFTLMRLSRFNELTAVLAAGVPLLRVAAPIILASVVLNVLLVVDQELIIPRMIPKLVRSHDDMRRGNYYPVQAMKDENNRELYAARFWPASEEGPARREEVDVIERDPDLEVTGKIRAKAALWDHRDGHWLLTDGRHVGGLRPDEPRTPERPVDVWQTSIKPEEIVLHRSGDFIELLSTSRINQLLARPKSYGANELLRVKHWRFTAPLMNVVLLLLAIPAVLTREPGQLKTAATKCLILSGLAMGSVFLAHQVSSNPPRPDLAYQWPALISAVPILLWGPIAVFLLDRVKT